MKKTKKKIPNCMKKKTRVTVTIDRDLIRCIRSAVNETKVTSFAALVEYGMRVALKKLEKVKGRSFKPRDVTLKVGRPKKSDKPKIWGKQYG